MAERQLSIENLNNLAVTPAIPTIVTWNRLEGRPRTEDFDRSLRAEIRDALWMLTRQWQFGEFQGEDAGSAINAKVSMTTSKINRYAIKGGKSVSYDENVPLETEVEKEDIVHDLSRRVQLGRQWLKMLNKSGITGDHKAAYLTQYPIDAPVAQADMEKLYSNKKEWQAFEAVSGRVIDGSALAAAIQSGEHKIWVDATISDPDKTLLLDAADTFSEWVRRIYYVPANEDDIAWAPQYLEYQFACSAPDKDGNQTVLTAEQYHRGRLDWYSFDIDSSSGAALEDQEGQVIEGELIQEEPISFIPSPVSFGGMPNVRWWKFEDQQVDLGSISSHTTDIAKLLLAEFGLIYGNDWSVIPYDLEAGTLCEIQGIVVTNVFGERTFISAAGAGDDEDWQRWSMYNLNTSEDSGKADNRLFLTPAIGKMLQGSPVESVNLIRDEMANMVWAIENRIPGEWGKGINGFEAAVKMKKYLEQNAPESEPVEVEETDALIKYTLGTTVPDNWIPFISVHVLDSNRETQLQRAAMPRLIEGSSSAVVYPRGVLLQQGIAEGEPYYIHEEEVPRSGAIVNRAMQRTRWYNGKVFTWMGRRKKTGRGEGSSGLKFDQIKQVE